MEMIDAALVLEGGGMRGLYTAGILDFFLEKNVVFKNVVGVSAGVCHGVSYVCGQKGRARDVALNYLHLKNYCGMYSLITTGNIFNVKMVYDTIPNKYYPLDVDFYKQSGSKLYSVVTDCEQGEAKYQLISDPIKQIRWIQASASMPMVSHRVKIEDRYYLDGGIADSVPIEKSMEFLGEKQVVVLTQPKGYKKDRDMMYHLMKVKYMKYPKMLEKMKNRHLKYNQTINLIDSFEAAGKIFVIRPEEPLNVSRVEKDMEKLLEIYSRGYKQAEKCFENMNQYLLKKEK